MGVVVCIIAFGWLAPVIVLVAAFVKKIRTIFGFVAAVAYILRVMQDAEVSLNNARRAEDPRDRRERENRE